jgi:glutaminase-like protein
LPVRLIEPPEWMKALCDLVHGAAPPPPPPPSWGSDGPGRPGSHRNPLTLEQAARLFELMKSQEHIPFRYAREYCFARAHEMYRLISELGIDARKVWTISPNYGTEKAWDEHGVNPDGAINVEHRAQGRIDWVYHVAPTVSVQTADGPVRMVIDPSLFEGPVKEADWKAPDARFEETDGRYYKPGILDDDYSLTKADLEEARQADEEWRDGIRPLETEAERDGIVPDEESEEDSDEVETSRQG